MAFLKFINLVEFTFGPLALSTMDLNPAINGFNVSFEIRPAGFPTKKKLWYIARIRFNLLGK